MSWKIQIDNSCEKTLSKLDKQSQTLIVNYLKKITNQSNPKNLGKPLRNRLKGLWRYRVNKFRIICRIRDKELIILVLKIAKRDIIYND